MLEAYRVREIERLLAEGKLSQRAIARTVGVHRATVTTVVRGNRRIRRSSKPRGGEEGELDRWLQSAPARCPGCGLRVHVPCQVCVAQLHRGRRLAMRRRIDRARCRRNG